MLVIYRISNNVQCKPKVPGATKLFCLKNALHAFPDAEWIIIADNCDDETIKTCQKLKHTIVTNLGNCGSFRHALDIACYSAGMVYFLEDDYLHRKGSDVILVQGLQKADYVTLYNHPDKFEKHYNFGEISKVMRLGKTYWKQTVSTTMTFAAKVRTLQEDRETWLKHTQDVVPHDHEAFCSLNRTLICPIPGLACHMDFSDSEEEYLPDWVVKTLINYFRELLGEQFPEFSYEEEPIRQLKIMQALVDIGRQ